MGLEVETQVALPVVYKSVKLEMGFKLDILVNNQIIIEIKSTESLHEKHISQCLNYLHVSGHRLAIIVNFNKTSLEYKRIIK